MARRGFLATISDLSTSLSWNGDSGPDPDRPADYGPGAGLRRPDRYVGTGQPRQEPDRQKLRRGPVYAPLPASARPLTSSSPAGGRAETVVDFREPDPVGSAQVRSINAMYGAGQAGELGEVRWGMPGMPRDATYAGELGPMQQMHGAQTVGQTMAALTTIGSRPEFRGGMMTGLPSTTGMTDMPLSDAQTVLIETMGYWG